jgi:hypothetical protein
MKTTETIIKRLIAFPFVAALLLVSAGFHFIKQLKDFAIYGCELIPYRQKDSPKFIADVFDELVSQRRERDGSNTGG